MTEHEDIPKVDDETLDDEFAGEGLGPAPEGAVGEERRSRQRWKKREVPEGLWLKCESCSQMIYRKELEEKGMVCPACDFHFTLPGRDRVAMLLDEKSFAEHFGDLRALDRLKFTDQIPYSEKVKKTEKRTGQKEALICGTGKICLLYTSDAADE